LLSIFGCEHSAPRDRFTDAVRTVLQDHIDGDKQAVGIVIGIVDENGPKVIYYGNTDKDHGLDVNGDTLFEIASITKTFTALLLQGMVERGEMQLDDPVAKYLPNSVNMPRHGEKEITLLHLATHTSGLPRDADNLGPKPDSYAKYTVEQMYSFLSNHTLTRDPGAEYEYSNLGAALLGHVIALKAGKDYETLVQERICKPLEMDSTRILLTDDLRARAATGHDYFGDPVPRVIYQGVQGAGGIYSTPNDMLKYLSAQIGLTESHLKPAIEKTHAPRLKIHSQDGADTQALAWISSGDFVWHTGGTTGYAAFAGFNTKQRRGIVVLCNSARGAGVYPLVNLLMNSEWSASKWPQPTTHDHRNYDSYVGQYQLAPGNVVDVRREGDRLLAQMDGHLWLELIPESTTDFVVKISGTTVTFVVDDQGEVTSLISNVNGSKATFVRKASQPAQSTRPPHAPVFVKIESRKLAAFEGRFRLPTGKMLTLAREGDHIIMSPDRRGGLELCPTTETTLACAFFQFEVALNRNDQGETVSVKITCPEPDYSGIALKVN
jgi:CubicO group peptidase (beta-lactamase class C family)